jgi:hypothetical protein
MAGADNEAEKAKTPGHGGHEPGQYPDVHDEAGSSPRWVPFLGLGLLGLALMFGAYRAATADEEPEAVESAEVAAADAEGEAPAPAPPAAAPAPAPVPSPAPAPNPNAVPAPAPTPAGGPDAHGRQPGEEHYGHDHP